MPRAPANGIAAGLAVALVRTMARGALLPRRTAGQACVTATPALQSSPISTSPVIGAAARGRRCRRWALTTNGVGADAFATASARARLGAFRRLAAPRPTRLTTACTMRSRPLPLGSWAPVSEPVSHAMSHLRPRRRHRLDSRLIMVPRTRPQTAQSGPCPLRTVRDNTMYYTVRMHN